ncbi:MAG TPA: hypothetical protein DEA80_15925 [Afipia sp.]|nr:hypothetical protein [Afipia sp.]OUX63273.1 MAG: hypothetical protein CBB64_00085 [Afipia sp. TMED4]HAP13097.1 hypothetical protein [Afipia sp.]HAP47155.1 hypothetical protein [Afipia sp.]HBR46387.1 hypothetical protein [Afipia sp.]
MRELDMTVHINLSDDKPYLLSVADTLATLSDQADFQSVDQAQIICGDLRLPSDEIVTLMGQEFMSFAIRRSLSAQPADHDQSVSSLEGS